MANPTTYFGWVMPNSADLVTDLPADFNVFGQGVDTSMQDLLGGTTGQVLSKTSGTNMDFTWVTPTDQTPLTTKGDLFTFSTVDARLAVGATNGMTLQVDSAEATGLKWATPASGGKVLQVVSASTTTATTIASTSMTDSGITATITPTSATSKILVIFSASARIFRSSSWAPGQAQLLRGATKIIDMNTESFLGLELIGGSITSIDLVSQNTNHYLDSPATTSATTYKVQGSVTTTANSASLTFQFKSSQSTITLLEIGA